jgi:uncharacterized repeat protein (TIGR01451 family)
VRTSRFAGAAVAAVALVAAGALSASATLLAAAAVPVAYLAYGGLSGAPDPTDLVVERTVGREDPFPGDRVTVTLAVRNPTETTYPDVRVTDGVPDAFGVVDGSPRGAAALPPGEEATVEYTITATRGTHTFADPRVRVRGVAATGVRDARPAADGAGKIDASVGVNDLPLRDRGTEFAGPLSADAGGAGIEFHATREYRAGDPLGRVDWRHYAKNGELTTVEYREQRAARVVLLVDARPVGDVAAARGRPTGADLSTYAAARAFEALRAAGHHAGTAVFGVPDPRTDRPEYAWVPPGGGSDHAERVAAALEAAAGRDRADATAARTAADGGADGDRDTTDDGVADLCGRLPPDTQVVLSSPALDGFAGRATRHVLAHGHPVTVISPDAAGGGSPGADLAAAERCLELARIRETDATVVEWGEDTPLSAVVAAGLEGVV